MASLLTPLFLAVPAPSPLATPLGSNFRTSPSPDRVSPLLRLPCRFLSALDDHSSFSADLRDSSPLPAENIFSTEVGVVLFKGRLITPLCLKPPTASDKYSGEKPKSLQDSKIRDVICAHTRPPTSPPRRGSSPPPPLPGGLGFGHSAAVLPSHVFCTC